MLLGIYLGNTIGYLLEYVWNINWFVLGLMLVNYFDTSIGSLLCSSFDLALSTLMGAFMGPLLGNYLGRYPE